MSTLRNFQAERNIETQDAWKCFENHRQQIARWVLKAVDILRLKGVKPTLVVLGAGNGNDLDLTQIAGSFESIDLIDLDPEALERIQVRYAAHPTVLQKVRFLGAADVTGMLDHFEEWKQGTAEYSPEWLQKAREPKLECTDRNYSVVLSACLLTQLIDSVVKTVGENSPLLLPMIFAVRDGHLDLAMRLMTEQSCLLLVTDFVSSDTLPELKSSKSIEEMQATIHNAIAKGNFFTGVNPMAIAEKIQRKILNEEEQLVHMSVPWKWRFKDRCYCVACIACIRGFPTALVSKKTV